MILYEMLSIIPPDDWMEHIIATRYGGFLQNDSLLENEKVLLSVLLAPHAADRPSEVQDVIEVVEILRDNYIGNRKHDYCFRNVANVLNINLDSWISFLLNRSLVVVF